MALEIIGAGFGRTGTLSVQTALTQLGFPCYHMVELLGNRNNRSHLDFWHKVAIAEPGTQHHWEQVFAKYSATVDNPGCCVWRELVAAYPNAKVLLTVHPRGAAAWYESNVATIYAPFAPEKKMWQFELLNRLLPTTRKFRDMSQKLIWQRSHRGTMDNRERAIAHYNHHIEEVRSAVPSDRLLVFSVDQGWEPLCQYLGVPTPDTPFPKVNDRIEIQRKFKVFTRVLYAGIALLTLLCVGGIYAVFRMFA